MTCKADQEYQTICLILAYSYQCNKFYWDYIRLNHEIVNEKITLP